MPFEKVQPEKLSGAVVRQIELLILRGILRPGERLPSERDMAEAVAEGVKEEGDDEGVPVLNAFEVVNLFGSLSLNRMLAGKATRTGNTKFVTEKSPATVLDKAVAVLRDSLGGDVRRNKETCRVEAEVLTKNGAIGVNV